MPSALIQTRPSYPAMPLTGQRVHQRSMHLGPLVLEMRLLKFRTPTADKDQQFDVTLHSTISSSDGALW